MQKVFIPVLFFLGILNGQPNPQFVHVRVDGNNVTPGTIKDVTLNVGAGEVFVFRVAVRNDGNMSPALYNNLSISIKQFTSESDKDYISVNSMDSDHSYTEYFGSQSGGGPDGYYDYVMAEFQDNNNWLNGENILIQLNIKPKAYTTYEIFVRTAASNQQSWTQGWVYNPASDAYTDCTGKYAYRYLVRVNQGPPGIPVTTSASSITQSSFVANWNTATNASGYKLDVSSASDFSTFLSGFNGLNVGNVTSYPVPGLNAGIEYFYRVRSYNDAGESSNSNTMNVYTIPSNPAAISATNILSTSITANWNSSTGAFKYFIDVSTEDNFSSFVSGYSNKDVGNTLSEDITGLAPMTLYYYRIRASNSGGTSSNSNTITTETSFDDNNSCASATPVDVGIVYTTYLRKLIDLDDYNSLTVLENGTLNINTDNAFQPNTTINLSVLSGQCGSLELIHQHTNISPGQNELEKITVTNGTYIIVYSIAGNETGDRYYKFSLRMGPLTPVATSASNISSTGFRAHWNTVNGATGYRLDVATDESFENILSSYNYKDVENISYDDVSGLSQNTTYYYRVMAYKTSAFSNYSNTMSVTTLDGTPPYVVSVKPTDTLQMNGNLKLKLNTQFIVTFNEPINSSTLADNVSINYDGIELAFSSFTDLGQNTYVFTPSEGLRNFKTYTFKVLGNVKDLAGNKLDGNLDGIEGDTYVKSFSTVKTGVTILIHGFVVEGNSDTYNPVTDYWNSGFNFIGSILNVYGGGSVWLYNPASGALEYQSAISNNTYGEKVIVHNWAKASNDGQAGQAEAAAEALFCAIIAPMGDNVIDPIFINLIEPSFSLPIHIIGHSRGASVGSELAQRLGIYNVTVNYSTFLDNHDFGDPGIQLDEYFHDPAVQIWSNVLYADNYYQQRAADQCEEFLINANPRGRQLEHLLDYPYGLDLNLNEFMDFNLCNPSPHSRIINFYFGTIDTLQQHNEWYSNGRTSLGFFKWILDGGYEKGYSSDIIRTNVRTFSNLFSYYATDDLQNTNNPQNDNGSIDDNLADALFFNGNFNLQDIGLSSGDGSLAGWSLHGGEGNGSVSNGKLELDWSNKYRVHNRFYIPQNAKKIKFKYKINTPSSGAPPNTDSLGIFLTDVAGNFIQVKYGYYLNNTTTDYIQDSINLAPYQNSIRRLKYEIMPNGIIDSEVWIDDIEIDTTDAPLPVELTSFKAIKMNNTVSLFWKTETETNNYGFEVEKRIINSEWSSIGFIKGSGTTFLPTHYDFLDNNSLRGKLFYRLKQIDHDGIFKYSQTIEVDINSVPVKYYLSQNYPNPFNPSTTVAFDLPMDGFVSIKVFDMLGREITTLVNEERSAGSYSVAWNATHFASGLYVVRMTAGNFTKTIKMALMK